ncbi:MAG: LysR family transcriptional regulator [Azospirillaceae bacterium]
MRHLRYLHYVDAVARAGSIRKAAEGLNVVSSALNRRILDIEDELGAPIFERQPRGVRLTAAGELFLGYIRRSRQDLERVRSEIEDLASVRRGTARIAAVEAVASSFLGRVLADFHADYPRIGFVVSVVGADQAVAAVTGDDAEIGFTFNPSPDPRFHALRRKPQRLCALMGRDHPLAGRASIRLEECIGYPLAIPDPTLGGRNLLDQALTGSSLSLHPTIEANSFDLMIGFALATGGIALQVEIGGAIPARADALAVVPLEGKRLQGEVVLGVRRDRILPVGAAVLCETLVERMDALVRVR